MNFLGDIYFSVLVCCYEAHVIINTAGQKNELQVISITGDLNLNMYDFFSFI